MLDKVALDRCLTTEPDNGYIPWLESVWDLIPESEVSADEYDANEKFFDDGAEALAISGRKHEYISTSFAAQVLIRRFNRLKQMPHCKTWENVQKEINRLGY